jgi:hypothetical protein
VLAGDGRNNLLPVESAVLNENLAGKPTADNHARNIHSRDITFERFGIACRLARLRIEANA